MRLKHRLLDLLGAILLSILFLESSALAKAEDEERIFNFIQRGEFTSGIAEAQKILKDKPEDAEIRKLLSMSYLMNGQPDEALSQIKIVLEKDSNNLDANRLLMNILAQKGNGDDAIKIARKILDITPDANAFYMIGVYYWSKGSKADLEKSIDYLTRSLEIDPSREKTISENLMGIYIKLSEFKKAKEIGERVLGKISDRDCVSGKNTDCDFIPNIKYFMSICYAQENNSSEAIKFLQQAISLDKTLKNRAKGEKELFGNIGKLNEFENIISQ